MQMISEHQRQIEQLKRNLKNSHSDVNETTQSNERYRNFERADRIEQEEMENLSAVDIRSDQVIRAPGGVFSDQDLFSSDGLDTANKPQKHP